MTKSALSLDGDRGWPAGRTQGGSGSSFDSLTVRGGIGGGGTGEATTFGFGPGLGPGLGKEGGVGGVIVLVASRPKRRWVEGRVPAEIALFAIPVIGSESSRGFGAAILAVLAPTLLMFPPFWEGVYHEKR